MGKVPTKKTSGRKQARPEFDEDAQWTEEYLNGFTVAILKDVIQKLNIRVNGRLKADLVHAMIDYRSPEQKETNETASQPAEPQTTRPKRKRDVATSNNEKEDERATKRPRRGNRRVAAKSKRTEPSSDEEGEEEKKAPPPQTPARHNDHTVSSPPPRPHRPKRKSIARGLSLTPERSGDESRRGSPSSHWAFSPDRYMSPEFVPATRSASFELELEAPAPFVQEERVEPRPTPREVGDEAPTAAEAHVEELAAPETRIEPRPTVLMRPHEALDGGNGAEVSPVAENHVEPRPTVLMRPHEALDAADNTLQAADAKGANADEDSDDEMDEDSEDYRKRFFSKRNKELLEGHLTMTRINATYLAMRALHNEMAVDIELMTKVRHAAGVEATQLKSEGREFPVDRFSNMR
ncbi:hypothetical protein CPB85DRAFT_118966 [Mucidula mucida]|nr:hypothetical protein CPB85DRAFT_118966 [Mucidula mucida]